MTKQQSQIYMILWGFPLVTPIISGVGRILGGQALLELGMVTYWISRTRSRSIRNETLLEIPKIGLASNKAVLGSPKPEEEH